MFSARTSLVFSVVLFLFWVIGHEHSLVERYCNNHYQVKVTEVTTDGTMCRFIKAAETRLGSLFTSQCKPLLRRDYCK